MSETLLNKWEEEKMTRDFYETRSTGVLAVLRSAIPERNVSFSEALRVAELQAARLLELSDVTEAPVPEEVVLSLPHIVRRFHSLRAASGMTYWRDPNWIVGINGTEPLTRQRFTLLHEFKHIIDHGSTGRLYRGGRGQSSDRQAELAADFFAGCALVPKRLLKQAWYRGIQYPAELAKLFDVSVRAIEVRLQQVGLREDLAVEQRPGTSTVQLPHRPADWYCRLSSHVSPIKEPLSCLS